MFILAQPNAGAPGEAGQPGKRAATPAAPETKKCAACGASFACYPRCGEAGQAACWCAAIKISAENLSRLRGQYQDCLCEGCLRKAASPTEDKP